MKTTANAVSLAQRPDLARIASWDRALYPWCWIWAARMVNCSPIYSALKMFMALASSVIQRAVVASVRRGVSVIQQDLEEGLALFENQHFDTVVLSKTLQSMINTEHILREMARVARYGIVSFPNFGHWSHGLSILGWTHACF